MPKNILIATLGDHPAVVTGMVKALRELEGINVDTLHVIHTQDTGKHIAQIGYPLIQEFLEGACDVRPLVLPFADPNSRETSLAFLHYLAKLLSTYQDPGRYRVYLSLAGGRKNMSALMALVAQFFPAVRGLYHLLDRGPGRSSNFPSIEEILYMSHEQQLLTLNPPLERLNLIPIPYPGAFVDSSKLWRFLTTAADQGEYPPIPLSPEAEAFFRAVFSPEQGEPTLQVWLNRSAHDQYRAWKAEGSHYAGEFLTCFKQMREPRNLKDRIHGTFGEYHFYKRPATRERPFYHTEPNPIHMYPERAVERVVISGLAVEQGSGQYKPTADELLALEDREPYIELSALERRDLVLLVPLGKTPMIATQTYTLLQESEDQAPPNVSSVAVLYPEGSSVIRNGVRMLRKQFERRGVDLQTFPINELRDVDSREACETYLRELLMSVDTLRRRNPDGEITLSLSGGRKGMSALALFAAQKAGVARVYHTLISDVALEERVERETEYRALEQLPSDAERAERLFLDAYDRQHFDLLTVPIIPFDDGG